MAKPFSTHTLVRGKEPMLRRMLCEVRYQDGQLYLDRCGRLLKQLLGQAPEWVVAPNPTPQGTAVYNLRTATQLGVSMNSTSLTLDKTTTNEVIDPAEAEEFLAQIGSVLGLVLDELEVSDFTRIGFREQYYFSFEDKEESEKWLQDLGLVVVAPSLSQAFAASPDALGVSLVLQGQDCRYRIALNGIERNAQIPVGETVLAVRASTVPRGQRKVLLEAMKKQRQRQINSAFAVEVDIDAFQLEPVEPDLNGFAREHAQTNLQQFREALPKDPAKKGR
jgi:hypothetical protein